MVYGVPDQGFVYRLVFMSVDVASSGDAHPIDFRMQMCQLAGQPPRRLRDDFQGTNNGINRLSVGAERLEVEVCYESSDRVNVVDDVTQALGRVLRRHGSRRA